MDHNVRKLAFLCDLYIAIWAIYCVHWYSIMPGTSFDSISSLCLAINIAFSIVCFFSLQGKKLPILFKGINILLVFFLIYGLFPIINGGEIYKHVDISPGSFLIGPLRSFLPIFVFYYFGVQGVLTEKRIRIYFVVFFILYLFFFMSFNNLKMAESSRDAFTNNLGYIFVSLIPFVFFFNTRIYLKFSLAFFIFLVVLFSMKRGAILVGVISLLYVIIMQWKSSSGKQKWLFVVIFTFILYIAFHYSYSFFASNEYFLMRINDTLSGDSSGRDWITKSILHFYFDEASFIQKLFGGGADNSMYICGGYQAHNDWLEILANQGLFGIVFYLFFWLTTIKQIKIMSKETMVKYVLSLTLLGIFIKTFFSMSYASFPTTYGLLIGYCLSQYKINEKTRTIKFQKYV